MLTPLKYSTLCCDAYFGPEESELKDVFEKFGITVTFLPECDDSDIVVYVISNRPLTEAELQEINEAK